MAYVLNDTSLNLGATSSSPFQLPFGGYSLVVVGATFGSVDFQILGPDNLTYVSVLTLPFTSNGTAYLQLPDGTYKFVVTGATGVYARVGRTGLRT